MNPENIQDLYTLTPTQQTILFHTLYAPETAVYVEQSAYEFSQLDVECYLNAWEQIIQRHEVLRSAFFWEEVDEPLQVVVRHAELPITQLDWQASTAEAQTSQLEALMADERQKGFDLSEPPLLSLFVIQLAADRHVVLINHHHIVLDGWSNRIINQEVQTLYEAYRQGETAVLPPPTPFREYISWLRQQDDAPAKTYWQAYLDGFTEATPLPTISDKLKSGYTPSASSAQLKRPMPPALWQSLQAFLTKENISYHSFMQAIWGILLNRYSGEDDVLFGTVTPNRPASLPQFENIVGMFASFLPVRLQFHSDEPVLTWLKQYQHALEAENKFGTVSLETIQKWCDLPHEQNLFHSLFINNQSTSGNSHPLVDFQKTNYALNFYLKSESDLQISYDPDLFTAVSIQRMLSHVLEAIRNILKNPDQPMSQLTIVGAEERAILLHQWNNDPIPREGGDVVRDFEAQVAQTPNKIAVVDPAQGGMTYGELNAQANRLARYLQAEGFENGRIGLHIDRSHQLVVCLWAILKSGNSYVPLDPKHPTQRLSYMIDNCQLSAIISHSALQEDLETAVPLYLIDQIEPTLPQNVANLDAQLAETAVILYTSGTTGNPKGVQLPQSALHTYIHTAIALYPITANDTLLQFASIGFDSSVEEIFATLLAGSTLILRSESCIDDIETFFNFCHQHHITILDLPTAFWHTITIEMHSDETLRLPPAVHTIIIGGEKASPDHVAKWKQSAPSNVTVINSYGPSEAMVSAIACAIAGPNAVPHSNLVPIGTPIKSARVYVVDQYNHLAPIGVPGELLIGGPQLALGYVGLAKETAVKFTADPFRPNAKVYRTGDLVRYLDDGTLLFIGRTDRQIKIRGHRIEPSAIEHLLNLRDDVIDTAVVILSDSQNNPQLVAYLISKDGKPLEKQTLIDHLKQQLPAYMIPAAFVTVDRFPKNSNGKINHRELPRPTFGRPVSTSQEMPSTPIQKTVATLFSDVTNTPLDQIGLYSNFFTIGGQDLLATKLITLLEKELDVTLTLRELVEQSTVVNIAQLVANRRARGNLTSIIPQAEQTNLVPVSFAQQRLLIVDQLNPNQATYNMPMALRLDGALDVAQFQTAVNHLYQRHGSLRTTFTYGQDDQPYQMVSDATDLPITFIDLTILPQAERQSEAETLAQREAQRPFTLTSDPLIRVTLLKLTDQQYILVIVMHHIISDGVSLSIFVRDLLALYAGKQHALPELPIQYTDFSSWQRGWLNGDELNQKLSFWKETLTDAPTVINLPTNHPRPKRPSERGADYYATISADLIRPLTTLSQAHNSSLFMTLLAAYNALLVRYTHQDDIVIGTPVANRTHAQTENLIGFFVNMLPLRINTDVNAPFTALLDTVRQTALDSYNHQDVPFEMIVDAVQPLRDTSYSPIFQVLFTLETTNTKTIQPDDIKLSFITTENKSAKYDLSLVMSQSAEGLHCIWEYSTDLFLPDTIARMHGHFETLLQGIVQNPQTAVSHLPLLTAPERHQLLHDWQGKAVPNHTTISLNQKIEQWAEIQPDALAVQDEDGKMSYAEINGRANQLARLLIQNGVQPGDFIGIHMTASLPAMIAIIASHKARSAYVPFDPAYPTQRLQFMLDDTSAPVILTNSPLDHLTTDQCTILHWQTIQPELDQQDASNLALAYDPTDPAYVIYTSGSTGQPKGVVCAHNGVFNLSKALDEASDAPPQAAYSLWTSLNFDASVIELCPAFINGGALHIVPQEIRSDAPRLFNWLADHQIQNAYLPPFMVEPLLHWLQEDGHSSQLHRLIVAVEPLSEPMLVQIKNLIPTLTLYNGYGPTEATVCSTYYSVPADSTRQGNAPIGRANINTDIYLLDKQMQLVPVGIEGELYVGGITLADGYHNRPDLTAKAFVPNPFSDDPTARLYRTGDIVRYLPDGNIMFVGRADSQLKIRGFRVELGSIETHLLAQDGVETAVILPHTLANGEKTLVAYFVTKSDATTNRQILRDALTQALPNYMVPNVWIQLDEMPRLPNDKIDRNALPAPNLEQLERDQPFTPPRNDIEAGLAAIWQTLLGIEDISVFDNFFELGGHSLLATQLVTRIRKTFEVKVALRTVFDQLTIAKLAQIIADSQRGPDHSLMIPVADKSQPIPVSFAQQRLLIIDQLDPNQATYNIPLALRLEGELDVAVLQTAVNHLYQRHDSLRTSFAYGDDGQPIQLVSEQNELHIIQHDLTHLPSEERQAKAEEMVREEAKRPFMLTQGPLIRVNLIQLDQNDHILVIVIHHIVTDGWSMTIFIRELLHLYLTQLNNIPSQLPSLPIQYTDFSIWQREWLQGSALTEQVSYWQNKLADAPTILTLPTDMPRPKLQSTRGADYSALLPSQLVAPLNQLSQANNSSLFMTLLAAFNVLLARYSNQQDIVIGTPIANRHHAEIENLIGFFVNMLPLRTTLGKDDTFITLLEQVRQTSLDAYNHQDVPFEHLVDTLQPVRDTSHSPIFQVVFTFDNVAPPLESTEDVTLTPLTAENKTAKYDLTLSINETSDGLLCNWEYSTDLFHEETIARLNSTFETLLASIVAEPETAVFNLQILPESEQTLLLNDWQGEHDPDTPTICLHETIEQWAAIQPHDTAVSDEHTSLTYAELNGRANQLARLLIQSGVKPSDPVGIHMSASVPALVSIIAIHKARSAYVPFDPAYPTQRLQLMLDDTQAPVIITNGTLDDLNTQSCTILKWDAIQSQLDTQPAHNLDLAYNQEDPAYIIYTSGSTGKPKGVVCRHTGVFNLSRTMDQWGQLPPKSASSLWTSLNFDASVYEMFPPFINGGALHIVPQEIRPDAPRYFAWLAKNKIQNSYIPPFMVEAFHGWLHEPGNKSDLRRLMVGVEPLTEPMLVEIKNRIPGLTIINAYGPTEATVISTAYLVPSESQRTGNAPIGRPFLNFTVYILDEQRQPVPIGVPGELYVGGKGLALGYLNRPELTAERFIQNPFTTNPTDRLYRTGDMVRYLPDGNIMFVGRADFQLKVRGFRIELGEIETHLLAQDGVETAVIMPHTASDGQISLVAYVVLDPSATYGHSHLRNALAKSLPNYMVPTIWIQLDEMPRLPNDKIDRKSLPEPNLDQLTRDVPFTAPRTPVETALVAIWQTLLNVDDISVHDNFFELGGHSLLATQLVSQVQRQFDVKLPLHEVFDQSTVAKLAYLIETTQTAVSLPAISKANSDQPIPVSFAQQRLLIIDQLDPHQATYNVPLALRLDGQLDVDGLQTAVNHLYQRHDALRTYFVYGEDGTPSQKVTDSAELPINMIDFSSSSDAEAEKWVRDEMKRPFTLTQAPLIRVSLLQQGPDSHILVVVMHHIITDGWSMDIFTRELLHLYTSQQQNMPNRLPHLPVQYTDFSAWQREWLQGDVLAQQIGYWETALKDAPTVLTLPTDLPRPKLQSTRGAEFTNPLPADLVQPLTALSQQYNSTLFMTLLTAYNILLARTSNQDDIVVGTPIANRNHPDIENIIGFFVNMLPLRTQIGADDNFVSLLGQVRQASLDAYNHQDVPFEKLVDALQPIRDTSHSPIFQVAFAHQTATPTLAQPADMRLTPLSGETVTSKYDLTLTVAETANGLICSWEYSTDLFLPETVARMQAQFETLLASILAEPETAVSHLQLLPEPERHTLLHEWQGQPDNSLPDVSLHETVEAWTMINPEATAVSDESITISYAELNGRANQLARLLIQHGVQPGNPIGIHMPTGVPAIISILAAHKARSAYVPFDPAYPTQRLQFMLDDSRAPVILTDSDLAHLETGHCTILQWEHIQPALADLPNHNLDLDYSPDDPAYIIYTSGSTGQPKGVVVGHTSVFNLLASFDQTGILDPQAASSLWTSLNFDVSVYEIFAPLVSGGQLHIVPADSRTNMHRLFEWLTEKRIASAYLPPFAVEPFANWLTENKHSAMRRLLVGVEPLAEQTLVQIQQAIPNLVVLNGYGPTEATVCATVYPVPAHSTRAGNAPIGRALLNSQLYVLDAHQQPVPIGVAGELFVGGKGLAHGYLNRPELTNEAFIQNPFSTDPTDRLYRTGDLVRYLPDGNLMFIGRADFQLKVRGFRIELGEIEAQLLAQDGVSAGVVVPHTAPDGQIALVAYFSTENNTELSPATLQHGLSQALPSYMVPAIWIPLDDMPRLPNDKIDRKALPEPDLETAVRATPYVAPRTAVEEKLVALWQTLLHLPQVGIHDNFFSLGGHSLLAMQMTSALSQALGKDVPLRTLFDAPTIAQLAYQLDQLDSTAAWQSIAKRENKEPVPLSFAQQRLWLIEEMSQTPNATYNIPIHLELTGTLDVAALETSFNSVLKRHDSLRTRFVVQMNGEPLQVVDEFTAVSLSVTDLSALSLDEQPRQAQETREANATDPFNLQTGPIYRIELLKLSQNKHQLLFTIHHIAFDAWSTDLFMQEVMAHYLAETSGTSVQLPELSVQYADYTVWQQERLTPKVMAEQLAFWKDHLADAPTSLDLPTDKPRPQWQSSHGDTYTFHIPPELATQVKAWSQNEQVTQYITFLTAFYALLHRYSNQEDVVVGSPIANRNHPDLQHVIGFFLNTLALRSHLANNTTWRTLLQQTRETMLSANANQEVPFENLVQALLPDRDPSRHPLFQVMFVLNNQGDLAQLPAELPIQLSQITEGTNTAKFDLLLDVQETAVGYSLSLEYNTDLFYPSTIHRMGEHFVQLLTAMVADPDQTVLATPMLTDDEAEQIAAWNDTAIDTTPLLVHHHFEAQVAQTPDAIALEFGSQRLSYAELNGRSNQLAHFIQKQGVQPNDLVGILLPRSVEMVTAVLATLKAGAGYVPLDPNYPTDRLQMMMAQANIKLVLTHSSVNSDVVSYPTFAVDQLELAEMGVENVTAVSAPDQIGYVIFTSGSTGTPKGVVLPHRALNNLLFWQQDATHNRQPARTLQFTSLSFDVHFQEFFTTWKNGGTLVLIPDDVRRDGEQLLVYIQKHHIERLFLPFVALHNLAEVAQWNDAYPHSLKQVITAGEALQSTPAVRNFFKQLGQCDFFNHYGPSETHVASQYKLPSNPDSWRDLPPIGSPIGNCQIHLLDSQMKPVPIGVAGELFIGGVNVALGYVNQPELTAERFIADPFADDPTARLYKTGDLARYLPDGNIEYLGRNDFQVKIRGHRVEIGEIEAVLNEHTAVSQAIVQAHKPEGGVLQLVAFVKMEDEAAVGELRPYLQAHLPNYMVPAHFVAINQFPLTASGKINRRALPMPDKIELTRAEPLVGAETELQRKLIAVWEAVLNVSPIGIHDNFFELGGHSLLALRLISAMFEETAVKVPLPRLFQEGTISAIANYISNPNDTEQTPIVTLRQGNPELTPLVLIHPGSGQVTPYLKLVQALPEDQPVYGLQSLGLLPNTPAQTDIESMATSYLQALASKQIQQPIHLFGWSMGGVVALEMAQQLAKAGTPVSSLTLIDTFAPTKDDVPPKDGVLLQWFAQDSGYLTPKTKLSLLPDEVPTDVQLRHLWPQLQATGNIPPALMLQDLQQQFDVFRKNYSAMRVYEPRYYQHPVSLVVARSSGKSSTSKALGWDPYLPERSVKALRANHFTLLQQPRHLNRIVKMLTKTLSASHRNLSSKGGNTD